MTCFLKITIYELGISWPLIEEIIGAASLWMVSTRTGEPAASNGRRDRRRFLIVVNERTCEVDEKDKC